MAANLSFQQLVMQVHQYSAHSTCKPEKNTSSTRDDERVHRERRQTCHRETRRMCSPRETTKEFTARNDERVHRKRRRTCSLRETTNEFTARNDERVHSKRRRMWLLRETTNVYIEFIVLIVSLECESVLWREVTRHKPKETGEDSFSDSCSDTPD